MNPRVKSELVRVRRGLRRISRGIRRTDRRLAAKYLAETQQPRLHVGCGGHLLDGWLNADLAPPPLGNVFRLDAARRFPFRDATFARVYSEHLIEHLSFPQAGAMLRECSRVLAPGGRVRIATPDLAFLIRLHETGVPPAERSALQERYIEWASAKNDLPGKQSGFVINHFMRAWGHEFIYDEPILRALLERSGFCGVVRRCLNESDDEAFRNLANEARMPDGFLRLETFTLEADKSSDGATGT